jgi:hypothetical protein
LKFLKRKGAYQFQGRDFTKYGIQLFHLDNLTVGYMQVTPMKNTGYFFFQIGKIEREREIGLLLEAPFLVNKHWYGSRAK